LIPSKRIVILTVWPSVARQRNFKRILLPGQNAKERSEANLKALEWLSHNVNFIDGQTLNDSIYRASIASRGKNIYPSENKGACAGCAPLDPLMKIMRNL